MILVLRALGLGDFLTAIPALRALADAFPRERRVLAAPAPLAPLVALSGAADDLLPARPLASLDAGPARPDIAVNLHGCGPESHRLVLALRPRRLLAYRHPDVPGSAGGPAWRDDEHEVARWCRLLQESGIPADPSRLDLVPPGFALPTAPPEEAWGATLVHPGAASAARRWPADRWAAVARAERERGRRVIVTGGADEIDLAAGIARSAGLPAGAVSAGRTSLVELASLVGAAGRVLSGDTGAAHLATALRTPSVVLFGPCSPARWGPPGDRSWHRVLWSGRVGDAHAAQADPGLLAITVDQVLRALDDLDTAPAPARRPPRRVTGSGARGRRSRELTA
jgi:ADP-heptose:LPS heptosyltransferase